jgi:hypothetical protein
MGRVLAAVAGACAALAICGGAEAAGLLQFTMRGTIISESPPNTIPGVDPNDFQFVPVDIHAGDTVSLTARFSSSRLLRSGGGYVVPLELLNAEDCDAGGNCSDTSLPALPPNGPQYFKVQVNGLVYSADMEVHDGFSVFQTQVARPGGHVTTFEYGLPILTFDAAGRFLDLSGQFEPGDPTPVPNFHNSGPSFVFDNLGAYSFNPNMHVFNGVWDVEGAALTAVPEPDTWMLAMLGSGLAGAALRRRRTVRLSACRARQE